MALLPALTGLGNGLTQTGSASPAWHPTRHLYFLILKKAAPKEQPQGMILLIQPI
ncbi:hypothetical protein [Paenibacillus sp. IITD108]|uniref:hypothetical protein n=1 Tax=Paenibacillus sp. IITD108 TaxID=3116649 RepID=UPI002F421BB9